MLRYFLLILILSFVGGWYILRLDLNPTFVEGVVGQPIDLIPGHGPKNLIDGTLERLLFRSLFIYNQEGKIVPDLVENYTISSNGEVYSITLKEVNWLDGTPITVTDVSFTFTREPAFSKITVEQEGERKIRFILENPLSSFLDILTKPVGPAHFRDLPLAKLGSSAFSIIEVKNAGGEVSEIKLRNNAAIIKNLIFKFFSTEEDLKQAALRGEVDGFPGVEFSAEYFDLYEKTIYGRYFVLFFNLESDNPIVKNGNFRSVAARKTPLFSGSGVLGPMSGTWAQANLSFPKFVDKDLKKFKGEILITVPNTTDLINVAERLASVWEREIGIVAKIKKVSASELDNIIEERNFEAIILGQDINRDPDRYNLWHSSQRNYPDQNISGYADPRADRALEEGRKVFSRSERKIHYVNFQRLFVENNPAIFLYHPNFSWLVNHKFSGLDLNPIFSLEERFWNFEKWVRN